MDFAGMGIPADRIKMIQERMKNQLEKTFILNFDKTASIYKEDIELDQSTGGQRGGLRMMMIGGSGSGKTYKNSQSKISAVEREISGKNFLIKDELTNFEWKMEEGTKMIGNYMAFKATTVVERPVRNTNFRFGRGQANQEKEEEKKEEPEQLQMELIIVTAWYTLDIPVNHGPGNYWGLPGLILEIDDGTTQILCSKIVLNSKEKVAIEEPSKGKVVSQKEFDKIMEKQLKEMQDRFQNERQKGERRGHMMRIGG